MSSNSAIVLIALLAACVALIVTGHGAWIIGVACVLFIFI